MAASVAAAAASDIPTDHGAEYRSDDHSAPLMLRLLGPVELTGTTRVPSRTTLHLLSYLALHRQGVDSDRLATALWPDRMVTAGTLRNRVADARAAVAGQISDGPQRRLLPTVACDWEIFLEKADGDVDGRIEALKLVRGRPFDGLPDAGWLELEAWRTTVELTVLECATATAEELLAAGDPARAFWAARAGLHANPYEEQLFRLAMTAAQRQGSTGLLRTLSHELRVVLGEDLHDPRT